MNYICECGKTITLSPEEEKFSFLTQADLKPKLVKKNSGIGWASRGYKREFNRPLSENGWKRFEKTLDKLYEKLLYLTY